MKLVAHRRVGTGKGAGRRIRAKGLVPAVLYGNNVDPVNLALTPREVKAVLDSPHGRNTVFEVEVKNGEKVGMALLREYQKHPVKRTLVHCDLLRLDPEVKRTFKVPLTIDGVSAAQKAGAKVRFVTRHVRVNCLPQDLPEAVHVDVSAVKMGESIRLADVVAPDGSTLIYNQNSPVFVAAGSVTASEEETEGEEGDGEEAEA